MLEGVRKGGRAFLRGTTGLTELGAGEGGVGDTVPFERRERRRSGSRFSSRFSSSFSSLFSCVLCSLSGVGLSEKSSCSGCGSRTLVLLGSCDAMVG